MRDQVSAQRRLPQLVEKGRLPCPRLGQRLVRVLPTSFHHRRPGRRRRIELHPLAADLKARWLLVVMLP